MMTTFVVDISNWQGDVDTRPWLAAGIQGAIAKALEGMTGVDAKWSANKAKLAAWGGVPGAYHYMNKIHAAGDQCNAFLDLVPADWIHALDAEAPGPLDVDGWFRAYRKRFPRKVVWLYTNYGMWRQVSKIPDMDVPAKWGPVVMWVAGVKPGTYQSGTDDFRKIWSRVPAGSDGGLPFLGFNTYAAMQFSGSASVPGVPGPCDMSVFGGTPAALRMYTAIDYAGLLGDDMSAADVAAINAHTDAKIDEIAGDLLGAKLGSSGPTVAIALQSGYQLAQQVVAQTDSLEASAAARVAAAVEQTATILAAVTAIGSDNIANDVAAKLGGSADAAVVRQAFRDTLAEILGQVQHAVEPPVQ